MSSRARKPGAAPATVNRELGLLQSAFRLAADTKRIGGADVPRFPKLQIYNQRTGFFEKADFLNVLRNLTCRGQRDTDLQDFLEWFFVTGMRPGEIKKLTWGSLDRETWTIRLHQKDDKTRKGRLIPLEGDALQIIQRRIAAWRLGCEWIFHRAGKPVRSFRKIWKRACRLANVPGAIPYALRRTAVRNMIRAGVDRDVAMKISGHRTQSTFTRYNITDEQDIRQALRKTTAYVKELPATCHVLPFEPVAKAGAS